MTSHIVNHPSAKGRFHALHTLLTGEWAGGLAALPLAPHRFLSHAVPCATVSDSLGELLIYVQELLTGPMDERLRLWACAAHSGLQPLKTHLLLASIADLLGVLRKANHRTQRTSSHVLEVDDIVDACITEVDAYGAAVKRAMLLLGSAPDNPDRGWRVERACKMIQIKKRDGHLEGNYQLSNGWVHEVTLTSDTIREVGSGVNDISNALKEDIGKRIAGTGVLKYVYILKPEGDVQHNIEVSGVPPLHRALAAWAAHFKLDKEGLNQQWVGVHESRKQHLGVGPSCVACACACFMATYFGSPIYACAYIVSLHCSFHCHAMAKRGGRAWHCDHQAGGG